MATFIAILEKTQNATAMKRVIDYVIQDKKTIYDLSAVRIVFPNQLIKNLWQPNINTAKPPACSLNSMCSLSNQTAVQLRR